MDSLFIYVTLFVVFGLFIAYSMRRRNWHPLTFPVMLSVLAVTGLIRGESFFPHAAILFALAVVTLMVGLWRTKRA